MEVPPITVIVYFAFALPNSSPIISAIEWFLSPAFAVIMVSPFFLITTFPEEASISATDGSLLENDTVLSTVPVFLTSADNSIVSSVKSTDKTPPVTFIPSYKIVMDFTSFTGFGGFTIIGGSGSSFESTHAIIPKTITTDNTKLMINLLLFFISF